VILEKTIAVEKQTHLNDLKQNNILAWETKYLFIYLSTVKININKNNCMLLTITRGNNNVIPIEYKYL
jgi:hypothetical protein